MRDKFSALRLQFTQSVPARCDGKIITTIPAQLAILQPLTVAEGGANLLIMLKVKCPTLYKTKKQTDRLYIRTTHGGRTDVKVPRKFDMGRLILIRGSRIKISLPIWVYSGGTFYALFRRNRLYCSDDRTYSFWTLKSRVFGEAGSDIEFWGGEHEKIRVKKRAKPFLSSRIFESRPNQNERSRQAMPKSSGFIFLVQVVLTILCPVPEPRTAVFRVINRAKWKETWKLFKNQKAGVAHKAYFWGQILRK